MNPMLWIYLGVPGILTVLCAYACWCNSRECLRLKGLPPLHYHADAKVPPVPGPWKPRRAWNPWPHPERLKTPAEATRYALLATDVAEERERLGELLILVGGAAFGASLPWAVDAVWDGSGSGELRAYGLLTTVLLVGVGGIVMRQSGVTHWRRVAAAYESAAAHLVAQQQAPEPPERADLCTRIRAAWRVLRGRP